MDDVREAALSQQPVIEAHKVTIPPQGEDEGTPAEAEREQERIMRAIQELDDKISATEGLDLEELQGRIFALACRHARLQFLKLNWVDLLKKEREEERRRSRIDFCLSLLIPLMKMLSTDESLCTRAVTTNPFKQHANPFNTKV